MDYTRISMLTKSWVRNISKSEPNVIGMCAVMIGLLPMIFGKKTGSKFIVEGLDIVWHSEMEGYPVEMRKTVKFVVILSIFTMGLTYHLYLLSHAFLVYALWSVKRSWAIPWLGLSFLRCIVIELLECFTGCAICSLYGELKPACLFFVTGKGINLAFSLFLWFQVFEFYLTDPDNPNNVVEQRVSQRSTDSVLADALYDWFIKEAETCERFDSDTAVDEDVRRFEERLAYRARQVLNMSPKELIAYEKGMRETMKETPRTSQNSTQTDEQISQSDSIDFKLPEESRKTDPLMKFPYITTTSHTSNEEFFDAEFDSLVEDVAMGTRNVEVQTNVQIPSQMSTPSVLDDDSISLSIEDL